VEAGRGGLGEEGDGVASIYRLPNACGNVGLIRPMSRHFCARCNRIRVTADGKLKPCLHAKEEISLRGLQGVELEAALRRGIERKPEHHNMDAGTPSESVRGMQEIGG